MRRTALALIAALPLFTLAQDAQASPDGRADWSIGAGLTFGELGVVFLPPLGSSAFVPVASASLERRIAYGTWLVTAVSGAIGEYEGDAFGGTTSKSSERAAYLAAGLRTELSRPRAPTALSVFGLVEAGVARAHRTINSIGVPEPFREETSSRLAGVSAGAAVEHALGGAISVRISSTLVRARVSWDRSEPITLGQVLERRSVSAGLSLAPRLELRLAF